MDITVWTQEYFQQSVCVCKEFVIGLELGISVYGMSSFHTWKDWPDSPDLFIF